MTSLPESRYAKSGDVSIAYQVMGDGPLEGDSHVLYWDFEPVAEGGDSFGTAVQLAARICAYAEPGQILGSNVVEELAAGKGFRFVRREDASLKGFAKPVRLHAVRWQS